MSLNYPGEWKFDGVGFGVPWQAVDEVVDLIVQIAEGSQDAVEVFKSAFGREWASTNYDFAVSDLRTQASKRAPNAALFVDNLWSGLEAARQQGLKVPSVAYVNALLEKHGIALRIVPPNLVLAGGDAILLEVQAPDAADDAVPRYVLHEQIGKGGFGIVYRATRTTAVADFEYAVKILDPSPFIDDYEKALDRFQREVRAIVSLQHRGIVPFYEAGLSAERKPYAVMPLIQGRDLRAAAMSADADGVISMFIEVTNALDYAHRQNVIHRDLKPTNILVRESDGQPIILDFGAAYLFDDLDSKTLTTTAIGTYGYMPKEVVDDPKTRSPLQDVYACGVMLYECLAGRLPDRADYEPLTKIDDAYEFIDAIVTNAIARVDKRTNSARAMLDELVIARELLGDKV